MPFWFYFPHFELRWRHTHSWWFLYHKVFILFLLLLLLLFYKSSWVWAYYLFHKSLKFTFPDRFLQWRLWAEHADLLSYHHGWTICVFHAQPLAYRSTSSTLTIVTSDCASDGSSQPPPCTAFLRAWKSSCLQRTAGRVRAIMGLVPNIFLSSVTRTVDEHASEALLFWKKVTSRR